MATKKATKVDNNMLIVILAVIAIVAIIAAIAINAGKHGKNITAQLGEEFTLNKNGSVVVTDGDEKITLSIKSDLNYTEGEDFKIPYVISVGGVDYSGSYTFADGYALHSAPNSIDYSANFKSIEKGAVTLMIIKNESTPNE